MNKRPVAVLGATGAVGQRFIQLLEGHPWFEVAEVAAWDRSAGKPYRDAATWRLDTEMPASVCLLTVTTTSGPFRSRLLFSGLDSSVAGEAEETTKRPCCKPRLCCRNWATRSRRLRRISTGWRSPEAI